MTPDLARRLLPLIQAIADGKTVECRDYTIAFHELRDWQPVTSLTLPGLDRPGYEYRIKPDPVTTVRPWAFHEVPPLCWVKLKLAGHAGYGDNECLVVKVTESGMYCGANAEYYCSYKDALERWIHSIDRKHWAPCGAVVTV